MIEHTLSWSDCHHEISLPFALFASFLQPVIFLLVVMVTVPSESLQAKALQLTTIMLRVSANMWPHILILIPAPGRYHKLERTRLLIKADWIEKGRYGDPGIWCFPNNTCGYRSGHYARVIQVIEKCIHRYPRQATYWRVFSHML